MKNKFDQFNEFIKSTIEKINDIRIIDLFERSDYVSLSKHGVNSTGCCPFHEEKTASFTVSNARNIYKCFGCGEGGDFIDFVKKYEKYTHPQEAVLHIAKHYLVGVIIPENPFDQKYEIKQPTKLINLNTKLTTYDKNEAILLDLEINQFNATQISNLDKKLIDPDLLFKLRGINKEFAFDCYDLTGVEYKNNLGDIKTIKCENIAHYSNDKKFVNIWMNWSKEMKSKYKSLPKYMNIGQMSNQFYAINYDQINETTYTTEGIFNGKSIATITMYSNIISLFASTNVINDIEKFRPIYENKHNIIAFDNDKIDKEKSNAGYKGMITLAKFIYTNYLIKSLKYIEFPVKVDANDLLKTSDLFNFINDEKNIHILTKDFVFKEYNRLYEIVEEPKEEIKEIDDPDKEYMELLNGRYVDPNIIPPKPPVVLFIRDPFSFAMRKIFSLGNISAIVGKQKSKKTFLSTMFAATLCSNTKCFGMLESDLPNDKRQILYFDTEQSNYDSWVLANRMKLMSNGNDNNLGCFRLKGLNPAQIIKIIDVSLRRVFFEVGVIFIDQLADLVDSLNDEKEAIKVSQYLDILTDKYNIHVCCILHENKANNNAQGWLGTQLNKKAESVINVTADATVKTVSTIELTFARGTAGFDPFSIQIKEDGLPVIIGKDELMEQGIATNEI